MLVSGTPFRSRDDGEASGRNASGVIVAAAPLRDETGRLYGTVGIIRT